MKKFFTVVLLLAAVSCLGITATACQDPDLGDKSIVCTVFPEYDWVQNIMGDVANDYIDVTLLAESGVDLHNYQPTVKDLAAISTCDLFIYIGGEADKWVHDALKNVVNKNRITLNLMEALQAKLLEEEEAHNGEEPEEEEETEYDEHIWLSLKNASAACTVIRDAIIAIDEVNRDAYVENTNTYITKLNELDTRYQEAVDSATCTTLLFGDRFPFLYLVNDYGIDYFAAFSGCSAESEASFQVFAYLQNQLCTYRLPAVCKIDGSTLTIAEAIRDNAQVSGLDYAPAIVTFDSLQSVKKTDMNNGKTYLSAMEYNLESLKTALGVPEEE